MFLTESGPLTTGELKMRTTFGLKMFIAILTIAGTNASASGDAGLISLADSLEPVKTAFNADSAKPRVVAILSPT